VTVNGQQDCNRRNDTSSINNLATPLCGTYTIGGASPNFVNFTEASNALNVAGITCPVIFRVRNGTYNEQVEIGQILGSSSVNTITFESESGDSSLAVLNYQTANTFRDYSLSLNGIKYLTVRKLGVLRTNGQQSVLIQGGSHHLSFSNNKLGNIYSPNTFCDSALSFVNNACGSIDLNNPSSAPASGIFISQNKIVSSLSSIGVNYGINLVSTVGSIIDRNTISSSINATANGGACSSPQNYGVQLSSCAKGSITNNTISSTSSHYFNNCWHNSYGLGLSNSASVLVSNNIVNCYSNNGKANSNAMTVSSCNYAVISDNTFSLSSNGSGGTGSSTILGIDFSSGSNSVIQNNIIAPDAGSALRLVYGIQSSADTMSLLSNTITQSSIGIDTRGKYSVVKQNTIKNTQGAGISISGGVNQRISENRISGLFDGKGISVGASNSLVANNYIQTEGAGNSVGISVGNGGTLSKVVFNSVNVTGTDPTYGRAFELTSLVPSLTIKNNIFANNGGGYAAYIPFSSMPTGSSWDYNCYYSSSDKIAFYNLSEIVRLDSFRLRTRVDSSSKSVNPYFN
jgi:hypothetical protein